MASEITRKEVSPWFMWRSDVLMKSLSVIQTFKMPTWVAAVSHIAFSDSCCGGGRYLLLLKHRSLAKLELYFQNWGKPQNAWLHIGQAERSFRRIGSRKSYLDCVEGHKLLQFQILLSANIILPKTTCV